VAASGEVARLVRQYDLGLAVPPEDIGLIAEAFLSLACLSEDRSSSMRRRISEFNANLFDRARILAVITRSVFP
jgi:hypothetical protein